MKIVFMGTPDFAVDSLDSIYKSNHDLCCVVTIPDKKAGRGQKMKESAVKKYCISNRIKILQPVAFNDKVFINNLKSFKADLFVVVAFKILPKIIWEIPCKGTINIHASLLPQLRGAAPINWAIINGLRKTGLTSFYINEGIDTGDIIMKKELEISENDNFGSLYTKLKKLSSGFIIDTIECIENGLKPVIQSKIKSELLKAPKIDKKNTRIRWDIDGQKINCPSRLINLAKTIKYDFYFIAEPWEKIYVNDEIREETFNQCEVIHQSIVSTYKQFNAELISLPFKSVNDRVEFILSRIKI